MEGKQRDEYLDFVKGIAVFLVVYGHCIQYFSICGDFFENIIFKYIYSFHMPLFMFISGYLFFRTVSRHTLRDTLMRKWRGILVPAIVWGGLYYIVEIAIKYIQGERTEVNISGLLHSVSGYWFIWSVFSCVIVMAVVYYVVPKRMMWLGVIVGLAGIICFPNMWMNVFMYPYFVIGFCCKEDGYVKLIEKKSRIWSICFGIVHLLFLYFFEKKHYIYTSGINPFTSEFGPMEQINIDAYRWITGMVGVLAVLSVLKKIYDDRSNSRIIKYMSQLGEHSM